MENRDNKTLVHFNTDTIKIYDLKNGILKMLNEERVSFGTGCLSEVLEKIKEFLNHLSNYTNEINNTSIVCDPRGVVGKGTIFEFGFMTAISKRIIFMEQPKNISIFFPYEIGLNF